MIDARKTIPDKAARLARGVFYSNWNRHLQQKKSTRKLPIDQLWSTFNENFFKIYLFDHFFENKEKFDEQLFVLKRTRLVDFVLPSQEVNSRPKVVKFCDEA